MCGRRLRWCLVTVSALWFAACDRSSSARGGDSAAGATGTARPDGMASSVSASGWDLAAGPFVVLPTVDGGMVAGSQELKIWEFYLERARIVSHFVC